MSEVEFALHELSESVAAAISSTQRELEKYPSGLGTFALDEIELKFPVAMRMDGLGQVRARLVSEETTAATTGSIQLRFRSLDHRLPLPSLGADKSLETLNILSPEAINQLRAERIFSVHDLLRVTRNVGGQAALDQMQLGVDAKQLVERALIMSLPVLPPTVAEQLLFADELKIKTPTDILKLDPDIVAQFLSEKLAQPIKVEDVKIWQEQVKELTLIPLPKPVIDILPIQNVID